MESRTMKFPYTWSARISQFPFTHLFKKHWIFRYYFYALVAASPVFIFITKKVNSPEYVAEHEEKMKIMHKKDAIEHAAKYPRSH